MTIIRWKNYIGVSLNWNGWYSRLIRHTSMWRRSLLTSLVDHGKNQVIGLACSCPRCSPR